MTAKNKHIALMALVLGFLLSFAGLVLKHSLLFPDGDGNMIVSLGFLTLQGGYLSTAIFSALMMIKFVTELIRGKASFGILDGIGASILLVTVIAEIYFYLNTPRTSLLFLLLPVAVSFLMLVIGILGYKAKKSTLCIGFISLSLPLFLFPFAVIPLMTLYFGV